jgi:hypothetical protein
MNKGLEQLVTSAILNVTKSTVSQINYTTNANQKQSLSAALLPIVALPLIIYSVLLVIRNIYMHQKSRDRSIYSAEIRCTKKLINMLNYELNLQNQERVTIPVRSDIMPDTLMVQRFITEEQVKTHEYASTDGKTFPMEKIESVGITFMLSALSNVCLISILGLAISLIITSLYFQAFGAEWRQTVLVVVYGLTANYIVILITNRINDGYSVMFNVLGAYVMTAVFK